MNNNLVLCYLFLISCDLHSRSMKWNDFSIFLLLSEQTKAGGVKYCAPEHTVSKSQRQNLNPNDFRTPFPSQSRICGPPPVPEVLLGNA